MSAIAFVPHVIDGAPLGPSSMALYAADLDNDADLDVVIGSGARSSLVWYENTDAKGSFSRSHFIARGVANPVWATGGDLDGDGDVDVLSATFSDDTVAWYQNNGPADFGPRQTISRQADGAQSVFAADIDNDGDLDVLSASAEDNTIAWYQNTDGTGTFGPAQVITERAFRAESVYAADLDGDGDADVLSASEDDNTVAWYENTDGMGAFGAKQVITRRTSAVESVHAADLDSDDDIDVLSVSWMDGKVAWYENTDGAGSFGPQQLIVDRRETDGAHAVYATDIDADGDVDVLSGSFRDGKIAWYENNGEGVFGPQQVIARVDTVHHVLSGDVDGDGDVDVIAAATGRDGIAHWYEQRLVGDSNNDGAFNSDDLVQVFQAGKYEDGIGDNATFDEGDWNQDGDFDSSDLVLAFQSSHYQVAAQAIASQIAASVDQIFAAGGDDAMHSSLDGSQVPTSKGF